MEKELKDTDIFYITRLFKDKQAKVQDGFTLSNHFPKIIRHLLFHKESTGEYSIPDTNHIICPLYNKKFDFQIGVTGGLNKGEDEYIGVYRELAEEIGIFQKDNKVLMNETRFYENKRNYIGWTLNLKHCRNVDKRSHGLRNRESRSNNKVACLVHGNDSDIEKYMNLDNIYRYYSNDNIIGVVFIQASVARKRFIK